MPKVKRSTKSKTPRSDIPENQKTELTSLIQDSIQSAIGQVVSQTTRKVLEVVGPSSQPSGQVSSRNDPRNGHDDKDPDEINSSTGEVEEEQHVEDMLSEEEPELEEESAIPIPPRSDGSLPPKPRGCNNNNNQIMGNSTTWRLSSKGWAKPQYPLVLGPSVVTVHHSKATESTIQTCKLLVASMVQALM